MFFVIGSVLLVVIAAVYSWRQLMPRYNWQPHVASRHSIRYHMYRKTLWKPWLGKDKATSHSEVGIGLPLRSGMRFTIKREDTLDKIYKWLGLASEFEVGDPKFDDHLYVICDDPSLCELLDHSAELRKLIQLMFFAGAVELTLNSRALYVRLRLDGAGFKVDVGEFVSWLSKSVQHLEAHAPKAMVTVNSSFRLQATLLMAVQFAMFTLGILSCGYLALQPPLLEWEPLFRLTAILTFGFIIIWFVLIGRLMRDSSRRPLVMTHFLKIGGIGVFLCMLTGLYDVNQDYSARPVRKEIARIYNAESKRVCHHKCSSFSKINEYMLYLEPWRAGQSGVQKLEVTEKQFRDYESTKSMHPGITQYVHITTHRGYFGWEWRSAVEIKLTADIGL